MSSTQELINDVKTASRTLDAWINKMVKDVETLKRNHSKAVCRDKENITQLEAKEKELHSKARVLAATLDKENKEVTQARDAVEKLTAKKKELAAAAPELAAHIGEVRETIAQEERAIAKRETSKIQQVGELRKMLSAYRKQLGLKFESRADAALAFCFTQIDAVDYAREFKFTVHVTSENAYEVTEVAPAVQGVDTLVAALNETNNLGGFVVAMRSKFVASVQ